MAIRRSQPVMGWWPPAKSIIESRRMPIAAGPLTSTPWSSGPRCAITPHMRDTISCIARASRCSSWVTNPAIPHIFESFSVTQTIQAAAQVVSSKIVFMQVFVKEAAAAATHFFARLIMPEIVAAHVDQIGKVGPGVGDVHAVNEGSVQDIARRWPHDTGADRQIINQPEAQITFARQIDANLCARDFFQEIEVLNFF